MEYKTNVMRMLDSHKIPYKHYEYDHNLFINGEQIANSLGQNPNQVFKTLVTTGKSGMHYVFMIPVCTELDLKRAAVAVGEKSISMLPMRELLGLTGYIHGGCSPIGMKKQFQTAIDSSANKFKTIIFSAGHIGHQVEVSVSDLLTVINASFAQLTI